MKRVITLTALILLAPAGCSGGGGKVDEGLRPIITGISPSTVTRGGYYTFIVTGKNFKQGGSSPSLSIEEASVPEGSNAEVIDYSKYRAVSDTEMQWQTNVKSDYGPEYEYLYVTTLQGRSPRSEQSKLFVNTKTAATATP